MKKVFFFGDSICVGQHIAVHKGWVTRISYELEDVAVVFNSSVSGRTTRQALEDMPYHIQAQHPDILIVQFGMNDCNYWNSDMGMPRVSPKAFKANLEEICVRAFNFGTQKVLLNTNHVTGLDKKMMPLCEITYQENNCQYNRLIRAVAGQSEKIILCDIEKVFLEQKSVTDFLLPDLLHPNELGHDLYFSVVYPILRNEVVI